MASRRIERLNELLRAEISDLINRELKDPRLKGMVSITTVDISPDLRHARVFVSVLGSDDERAQSLAALQSAAGFVRKELAHRIPIRHVPELAFRLDVSIERGERIMQLLREIRDQDGERDRGADEASS